MVASPITSGSSCAALALAALGLGACAGHGAPKSQAPTVDARGADAAGAQTDCAARATRARELLEAGKLWSTARSLEGCAAHSAALTLLVRSNLGLGKLDAAARLLADMPERNADLDSALREAKRVQKGRKPVVDASLKAELDAIRESLARAQCPEAAERARQSFERWTPNPQALMLWAGAASCQGDAELANSLYARAAAELEASPSKLAWYRPETVSPSGFTPRNELVLQLGDTAAVLRLGSTSYEAATLTLGYQAPSQPLWSDARVEVQSDGRILGRSVDTHETVWERDLPHGFREVVPAFSGRELLLVYPDTEQFRSFWYRLEGPTGKVVSQGTFPARYREIMASTSSDWFAASEVNEEQQPYRLRLVFSSGQAKSIDLATLAPCSPQAVLPPRDLLVVCAGELRALSVDTLKQRSLARFPSDFVAEGAVQGPGTTWAVRGRTGLALVDLAPDGTQASPTIIRGLQGYAFSSVMWSPTARLLAGSVGRADGRHGVVLWDLEASRMRQELWSELDEPHPDAALSATGDQLVVGGCAELGRLHLESAQFEMARLSAATCAGITVAPTSGVVRMSLHAGGNGVFWPEHGEPHPIKHIPYLQEAQATGPWMAANTVDQGWLLLPATDREVTLSRDTRVLALSPDGSFAAAARHEDSPTPHESLVLLRLNAEAASADEVWRLPESEFRHAAFTPDSRTLVLWSPTAVARLELKSLRLMQVDARWSDTGAQLLDESSGLFGGAPGLLADSSLIPLDDWKPAQARFVSELKFGKRLAPRRTFPLFGLSRQNRWIVGPIVGGAAIWRAPKGELVAQIQHSATGGWFVSAALDAELQRSLVQPLGTAHVPLWCRSGNELYEWRVCQDRFEEPALLTTLLTGRSE